MREREQDDLAACTLVGRPRKKSHALLKGQLAFEEKNGRLPTADEKSEVQFVLDYANKLVEEYFSYETPFTLDDAVKAIDHHEPAIITINAVVASLQSQDALRILHHLKGTELGKLPTTYTIYNGLVSNFFSFEKPQNPKCEVCGPNAPKKVRLKAKSSSTFQVILLMMKKHGFSWDDEFEPLIFRMDSLDMEEVTLDQTLAEINARNKETFMISGLERNGKEIDTLYLQLILVSD
jgi:hypothetical protein